MSAVGVLLRSHWMVHYTRRWGWFIKWIILFSVAGRTTFTDFSFQGGIMVEVQSYHEQHGWYRTSPAVWCLLFSSGAASQMSCSLTMLVNIYTFLCMIDMELLVSLLLQRVVWRLPKDGGRQLESSRDAAQQLISRKYFYKVVLQQHAAIIYIFKKTHVAMTAAKHPVSDIMVTNQCKPNRCFFFNSLEIKYLKNLSRSILQLQVPSILHLLNKNYTKLHSCLWKNIL